MLRYFDKAGNEIGEGAWSTLQGTTSYKIVRYTEVAGYKVSTVWLGIDAHIHSPPRIFETMVFGPDDLTVEDCYQRYSTEAEAIAGHVSVLEKASLFPPPWWKIQ